MPAASRLWGSLGLPEAITQFLSHSLRLCHISPALRLLWSVYMLALLVPKLYAQVLGKKKKARAFHHKWTLCNTQQQHRHVNNPEHREGQHHSLPHSAPFQRLCIMVASTRSVIYNGVDAKLNFHFSLLLKSKDDKLAAALLIATPNRGKTARSPVFHPWHRSVKLKQPQFYNIRNTGNAAKQVNIPSTGK